MRFGLEGLQRLIFPLTGIALLAIARCAFGLFGPAPALMHLVIAMLVAMGVVRLIVYALRQVFSPAGWLSTFEFFIALTIWTAWVMHAMDVLPEVIGWLDSHQIALGKQKLSLWALIQGGAWVLVTLIASIWISGSVERKLMRSPIDSNLRIVLARLAKVALMLLGLMITLPLVGIDLTALSVFGGALGVGLGFGLQKIMANYVSGFILLLDRSIRIGDLISVGTDRGQVTQITTRYTVVRSLSGIESIIPNETLISSVVQNEGLSDRQVRLAISVQVAIATMYRRPWPCWKRRAQPAARSRIAATQRSASFLRRLRHQSGTGILDCRSRERIARTALGHPARNSAALPR
jgi:small-conductance mechanosensitive channel